MKYVETYWWKPMYGLGLFSSVQSLSRVQLFPTPWTTACQASPPITNSWSLLKLISIESVTASNHLSHKDCKDGNKVFVVSIYLD